MDHRHLWLRVEAAARDHARAPRDHQERCATSSTADDFTLVDAPIFTPNACEGTSNLFETDYHGEPAYLTQSGQLYMEAAAAAFGKVYCFGPTFRAEKSKTRRHLAEFWMVEPEVAFMDLEGDMRLAEDFLELRRRRASSRRARSELKVLERDTKQARERAGALPAHHVPRGDRHPAEERAPRGEGRRRLRRRRGDGDLEQVRSPRHRPSLPDGPEGVLLQARDREGPEPRAQHGRARARGLRRDHRRRSARGRSRHARWRRSSEHKLPREAFEWYLDLRRYGTFPHAGFGLGIERTVSWICGLQHVRETIPFPRMLNRLAP